MSHQWITTAEQLQDWLAPLPPLSSIYIDTEFMRERTFWADLALIQVRAGDRIALIDAPQVGCAAAIQDLVGNYSLVMHAGSEDLSVLNYFTGVTPQRIYDTQVAAALVGFGFQTSYQQLVADIAEQDIPKGATRTNWLARPLSQEQIEYAKDDVVWLPTLHQHLADKLEALGRLDWWIEECDRLRDNAIEQTVPLKMWRQIKGVGHLQDGQQLARLQQLAAWRELKARERNLPRGFVLKDPLLLALAQAAPTSKKDLHALELPPPVIRRYTDDILQAVATGNAQQPLPLLPGPPSKEEKAQLKMLRKGVKQLSENLNVTPEVLMRRRWLEQWLRDPEVLPEPLQGWRREVVVEPLIPLL